MTLRSTNRGDWHSFEPSEAVKPFVAALPDPHVLVAVEIDKRLAASLAKRLSGHANLEVRNCDILTFDFEKEFRGVQKKLGIFSELTAAEQPTTNHLNTTSSLVPPEIVLSSLSFVGDDIKIEGVSPNERGIAQFVANLEASDEIEEVAITQISTDKETQVLLTFSLKLTLSSKGGK